MLVPRVWLAVAAAIGCLTFEMRVSAGAGVESVLDSAESANVGGVTVRCKLPVHAVPIAELCPKKLLPILEGATALIIEPPNDEAAASKKSEQLAEAAGMVRIFIQQDTPLYVGVVWGDDNGSGTWTKELSTKLDMPAAGWAMVGNTATTVQGKSLWRWLYWREAKAGESFRLRTRKTIAPVVIVPPAGAPSPLADNALDHFAESIGKEMLKTKSWYLANHQRFDELESLHDSFRKHRPAFPSSVTRLRMFFEGMSGRYADTDAEWQHFLNCVEAWARGRPESVAARIVWADSLRQHAISNTYLGYKLKRSKLSEDERQRLLVRCGELLEEARKLDENEPELYRSLTLLAIHLHWPPERVLGFLRRSAAADPTYLSAFFQSARYCFMHRDGGPPINCADWASEAAALTHDQWGDFAYTTMVLEGKRYLPYDELFSPDHFSWERTRQGFLDAEKRLPHSDLRDHEFCALACTARDRETAHRLFERLGNRRIEEFEEIWGHPMYYDARRQWARPDHLSGQQVRVFRDGLEEIDGVAWTLDGERLIAADRSRHVRAWDLATGRQLISHDNLQHVSTSLSVSSDGLLAATGDWNNEVVLWGMGERPTQQRLGKHPRAVTRVMFSPDGSLLASAGQEGSVMLWNVAEARRVAWWKKAHDRIIHGLDFTPDGQQLVTCAEDQRTKFWNIESGQLVAELPKSADELRGVLVSPDGAHLALADTHGITLWKLPERTRLGKLDGEVRQINEMAFSVDGSKLACTTGSTRKVAPGGVHVWDVASRRQLHDFKGHKAGVVGVSFSPDGKQLATGSLDLTIRIWQVEK
ncbi:MAG TPA: WD40 repeat domain-containing protein [Pirellulales bacterium]|jgi:hypothetical protein|nr:WD40 repeat domain-containing protein [Pirellulales bacterium]